MVTTLGSAAHQNDVIQGKFPICNICLAYEFEIKGQNTVAQREGLDQSFFGHTTETHKESPIHQRQVNCSEEKRKCIVAMDAFDKS